MTKNIKILDPAQISWVYETYMKQDFPKEELKPLANMLQMYDKGFYECLGLYQQEELIAYAFFVANEERQTLLLDYLAVTAEYRSGGIGGIFLGKIQEYFSGWRGILLECESECTAPDEEQLIIRRRRIQFYLYNHCRRTDVKCVLYDVDYEILYLPLQVIKKGDWHPAVELEALYKKMFPESVFQKRVQIWQRHRMIREASRWQEEGGWKERASLCDALGIGYGKNQTMPRIISFIGAGGKTTTMYQLADELAERGYRVVVTTSTHIRCPKMGWVIKDQSLTDAVSGDWNERIVTVGNWEPETGKLSAPEGLEDAEALTSVLEHADVVLIEADGAKEYPLKVPAEHEPVVLLQTDMLITCAGLTAIGTAFADSCFRMETHGKWLHRTAADIIQPEDITLILMDQRGSRKGVSVMSETLYRVVLNQADDEQRKKQAEKVVELLPEFMKGGCVLTAYERDEQENEERA